MAAHPLFPAASYDVVAISCSAGGVQAAGQLLSELPADFPAPIVLVQHLGPNQAFFIEVMGRRSALKPRWAIQDARLQAGFVHVAPPDRHLVIERGGRIVLDDSPRVHGVRPCADATFASAARTFGDRTLGVVLTGYGTDATAGAVAIRSAGGLVIVQQPETCAAPGMAAAVIAAGVADLVLPPESIAVALVSLVAVRGAAQLFGLRQRAGKSLPRVPSRTLPAA